MIIPRLGTDAYDICTQFADKVMTFDELLTLVSSNNAPGLCTDSRLVEAGNIFVALEGTVCDGHDFIDEALGKGAKYIVSQKPRRCPRACLRQADAGALTDIRPERRDSKEKYRFCQ